jgi:FAD:protein FMN transferase
MKPLLICATVVSLAIAASFAKVGTPSKVAPWRTAHYENVLGTSMEIKLLASSDAAEERAEAAALGEIKRLNGILSGYDTTSEFSRWSKTRNEAVPVSSELMEVLKLWDSWLTRTGGALNPAAEAVIRIWERAEVSGRIPTSADLAVAVQAAGHPQWSVDAKAGTATRLTTTPLVLNSFTKSYVVERAAAAALRVTGVTGVVVNIGGDLVVRGAAGDRINVVDPRSDAENSEPVAVLNVSNRAVATSGNYRRGFEIGGEHYSHIVDPRTGATAEAIIGATVVSPSAVDAGALATAFCVLTPEESRKLAASIPGTEYMLEGRNGTRYVSANWNSLQAPQVQLLAAAFSQSAATNTKVSGGLWNPSYELTVNVELPQTQGFGARRPYVAIWIEDKDKYPVRTLAVLFEKSRWLNELRAWYRDDRLRAMSEGTEILSSVTSATRSPGKYTFKWDGKDNNGKPVKEGRYTVLVEASREHGGNNVVRKELDFNGEPAQAQLPAGGELGAVTVDYHKVTR